MKAAQRSGNRARKHTRVSFLGKVIIHNQEQIFIAPLNNISLGGLFVEKLVSLDLGKQVKVIIKSAHFSQPLQAKGKIVRIESDDRIGSAVEFDWVEADFEAIILRAAKLEESTGEQ